MYVLHKAHYSLPALRITRRHFSPVVGGHFQRENHKQRAQKCKTPGTKKATKGCLFTVGELKQAAKRHLVLPQLGASEAGYSVFTALQHVHQ